MMPGWIETRTYIDDGASGVNFNRRGFQDMMEDARQGVINLVLVKDLSRFGRNYLEAGRLLEDELPALGCRFVALSDGIDTETGENDIIPFLNAINDFYVRDVSQRIKSVMQAKAKDGQLVSACPPYGYIRNPADRARLIIDEYAAGVVKRIYKLRTTGIGYSKVASFLNVDGILPPRLYYFKQQGRETKAACTETWTIRTIKLMLNNDIYLGHTTSLKRGTRSYRDHRYYLRDESEWIRVENTHPPIIDMETWDKVQRLNHEAKETARKQCEPQSRLFAGLVLCPTCGAKMGFTKSSSKLASGDTKVYGGYECRTFSRSGRVSCSSHRISENNLKALILGHIREMAEKLTLDEAGMIETLNAKLINGYKAEKSEMTRERRIMEQQLFQLENQMEQYYEDKVEGIVSAEDFYAFINEAEERRSIIESRHELLNQSYNEAEAKLNDINKWASLIKEKSALHEVDRDLLESLIDRIEIGEREMIGTQPTQDVRIFYKYVGLC
jgi:DNA invertase Pin-like site-specific DNA recombinase